MPRIRSVHPGLWTDEAFVSVSIQARLLMIGIWTEADDQGIFEWKPRTLKMRIFPADNIDVEPLLAELSENGIVRSFEHEGRHYGAVRNFRRFQRPKKPNSTHFMPAEFRTYVGLSGSSSPPVPNSGALNEPEFPTGGEIPNQMEDGGGNGRRRREDEDSDSPSTAETELESTKKHQNKRNAPAVPRRGRQASPARPNSKVPKSEASWLAYSAAYERRYGTEPVRNAKTNALLCQLVDRIGAEPAPDVAAFYVDHNNEFYYARGHAVQQLVADCEKLHMEWQTGRQITRGTARQRDRTATNLNVLEEAKELTRRRREEGKKGLFS